MKPRYGYAVCVVCQNPKLYLYPCHPFWKHHMHFHTCAEPYKCSVILSHDTAQSKHSCTVRTSGILTHAQYVAQSKHSLHSPVVLYINGT